MDFSLMEILASGGIATFVAWGAVQYFSKKVVEVEFQKRLESHKAGLEKELERSRFELNKTFNKFTRFYEKEFEVLSISWDKLHEAYWYVRPLTGGFTPGGIHLPSQYSKENLEAFLDEVNLTNTEKIQLRESDDMDKEIQIIMDYKELAQGRKKYMEFGIYFDKNKIFLHGELKDKLSEIDNKLSEAVNNLRIIGVSRDGDDFRVKLNKESSELVEDVGELIKDVEQLVQSRLDYSKET